MYKTIFGNMLVGYIVYSSSKRLGVAFNATLLWRFVNIYEICLMQILKTLDNSL